MKTESRNCFETPDCIKIRVNKAGKARKCKKGTCKINVKRYIKNESKNLKGLKDLSDHQTNRNEGMKREKLGNSSISCINSSAQISLSRKVLVTTSIYYIM